MDFKQAIKNKSSSSKFEFQKSGLKTYFYGMLSILIPVYNFDIRSLVVELHRQCIASDISFEIRCLDDGSTAAFKAINQELQQLEQVIYQELEQNVGRSKIRNRLGESAMYDYLLFMDCDAKVNQDDYIQLYISNLDKNTLLYGGRSYQATEPEDKTHYLHWLYGAQREQQEVGIRRQNPYHSFMTNNFLIPKAAFLKIKFEEKLTQYGHEDTLFGLALAKQQIKILHLDNPLEHIGLEAAALFLKKSRMAIENLYFLSQTNREIDTKLLRVYKRIKQWRLNGIILLISRLLMPFIQRNLLSEHPNLKVFDFYKLAILLRLEQENEVR